VKMIYSQQAVVRVWRNLKMLGKVPTSHFGHAAVTVMGTCVKTTPGLDPYTQNISFWPGEGAGFHNAFSDQPGSFSPDSLNDKINEMNALTAIRLEVAYCRREGILYPKEWNRLLREEGKTPLPVPLTGQKRIADSPKGEAGFLEGAYYRLKDGTQVPVPAWSQSPQSKICLPGLRAAGKSWGLNTNRMGNWWIDFQKTNAQYRAFSPKHNCVGVALEGLREGGAAAILPLPKVRSYGEPIQVEQYAQALEYELNRLEGQTHFLDMDIRSCHLALKPVPVNQLMDGLWQPSHWKKASALGVMYRRSPLIQEMDGLLEQFARLTWKYAFVEKFDLFVRLFRAVVRHRQDKSDSKRSESVAQLGTQILDILARTGFYDDYKPAHA
jgi:hypothetical protein